MPLRIIVTKGALIAICALVAGVGAAPLPGGGTAVGGVPVPIFFNLRKERLDPACGDPVGVLRTVPVRALVVFE